MPVRAKLILASLLAAAPAAAETLRVGPGERFRAPSEAAAAVRPGDRVLIAPGTYADCATWRAASVTVEAAPGGAVVITGPACGGKGLFVAAAPNLTVIDLTFRGAAVPDGNGAGIRGDGQGDLTVRRSVFENNENGILAGGTAPFRLVVEDSLFRGNGALRPGRDCAHGIYAGMFGTVSIRRSHFVGTRTCHHVKSRALRTEVLDSVIEDGPEGDSSYLVDVPNGGDLLLARNTLRKGPRSDNPNTAVMIGAEGVRHPTRSLRIENNRFENLQGRATAFVVNRSGVPAELQGNRLSGAVTPLVGVGVVR
ncbi:hypothetical protein [Roseomonas sp. BN140053]|uniref:hypothetical protein n=1 Tax=Roseomonas sp. BN140053 TaxID=3391898 RepID=UPI0039E8E5FE